MDAKHELVLRATARQVLQGLRDPMTDANTTGQLQKEFIRVWGDVLDRALEARPSLSGESVEGVMARSDAVQRILRHFVHEEPESGTQLDVARRIVDDLAAALVGSVNQSTSQTQCCGGSSEHERCVNCPDRIVAPSQGTAR